MNNYIGTKAIQAKEMTRGEYNKYRGWKIPPDEDPDDKGYLVVYPDDYKSWSPKEVFEKAYRKWNGVQYELNHDLITKDNTYILHDESKFNAPHNYTIYSKDGDLLCGIHFQEGPVKEEGLNGVFMEDLIAICINRLENFQKSDFSCRENTETIRKLEESLMWLRKRTLNRQKRGVQGTYKL